MILQTVAPELWLLLGYVLIGMLGVFMGYKITRWTGDHMPPRRRRRKSAADDSEDDDHE